MDWAKEEKVETRSMLQMKMALTQLTINKTMEQMLLPRTQKHILIRYCVVFWFLVAITGLILSTMDILTMNCIG